MPFGARNDPYVPGYGRVRKRSPNTGKKREKAPSGGYVPSGGSSSDYSPSWAQDRSTSTGGSGTSRRSRSSSPRKPLTPALTGSAITSLASRYLLESINEIFDPSGEPLFSGEGPEFYGQAYRHNEKFAKPGPYQARLSPDEEQDFRRWVRSNKVPFDPKARHVDYDMRSFWRATKGKGWSAGQHFPDTFKTPFDTTFSRESKYATKDNPFVWRGDNLVDRRTGKVIYGQPHGNPVSRALNEGFAALKGLHAAGEKVKQSKTPKGQREEHRARVRYRRELKDPLGKKSLGNISLADLMKARHEGTLRTNQAGKVTTPEVRHATRDLANLRKRRKRLSGALPGLDRHQSRVARTVLRVGDRLNATPREKLAAIETGLVESGLRNLGYGDADSEGWRQERTSLYGTGPTGPRNVKASADRFYRELRTDAGTDSAPTPGLLAQAAQGSAFPERYDEQEAAARAILSAYERGGSPGPNLQRRLQQATAQVQSLGIPTRERTPTQQRFGPPDKVTVSRFRAAMTAAQELEKAQLPYVWGGGHGDPKSRPTGGGLDCSGAVSYVLNKMGALKGSLVSGSMGQALEPGPGAVTVFYNDGHTFMKIGNKFFGTSRTNPGGGPGFIADTPDDLSKYNVGHVPGMGRKVAVQLGVPLTGGGGEAGAGITYSADGTTAVVSGGVTKDKPGYSDRPIAPSLLPISTPLAASAALPSAYQGLGTAEETSGEEAPEDNYIAQILRRRS